MNTERFPAAENGSIFVYNDTKMLYILNTPDFHYRPLHGQLLSYT